MMKKIILVILLGGLTWMAACKKSNDVSSIPSISFIDFTTLKDINRKDTTGLLRIYFKDGNGDIGLYQTQAGVDFYSIFVYKKLGIWTEDTTKFNYRIPYIADQATKDGLKGEIDITYNRAIIGSIPWDSIKIKCFLNDRAGNVSNTLLTPEFDLVH